MELGGFFILLLLVIAVLGFGISWGMKDTSRALERIAKALEAPPESED